MIKAIDFFCGAGGLTRGLLDAGIKVLAGVDNDIRLRATYESNNKPSQLFALDIRNVEINTLREELDVKSHDRVLYSACTPCQPFSSLTRMRREDDRKDLLLNFANIVETSPPDYILVENVPGLNNAYGRDVYQKFHKVLSDCGFSHKFEAMLDAKNYGVPQVRKRFILIASRIGPIEEPKTSFELRTVEHAISKYPPLQAGGASEMYFNHICRRLPPHLQAIVSAVPSNGGSRSEVADESILLACHRQQPKVHKDVFGRMSWSQAAPTLTRRCTDVYCGRFVHPTQDRGISLREAAAIQSFPDSYEFFGTSIHNLAGQIGNAVPVEFARRLGRAVVASDSNSYGIDNV